MCASTSLSSFLAMISSTFLGMKVGRPARVSTKERPFFMIDKELDALKLNTKNKLEKLTKLNKHEYDPNCSYCTSNVFVQDAMQTKKELEEDKQTVDRFLQKRKE